MHMYKARPVGVHVYLTHSGQWSTARPLCPNFEAVYGMTQSRQHMVDSSGFLIAEAITINKWSVYKDNKKELN